MATNEHQKKKITKKVDNKTQLKKAKQKRNRKNLEKPGSLHKTTNNKYCLSQQRNLP
jgi:hypothetical protein